jgi:hypothetical protein
MKSVKVEGTEPQVIIEGGELSVAVVCLSICNYGESDAVINLFACENGKEPPKYDESGKLVSGNEETFLIKELSIAPKNTVIFNLEKLLLHNGDKLYIQKLNELMKVSVIVSYEVY